MKDFIKRGSRFALAAVLASACMCPAVALAAPPEGALVAAPDAVETLTTAESSFSVSVSYEPSSLGSDAVFSPQVSREIAGMTFDFLWEMSSDGGKTWNTVSTDQTYTLKTTEDVVGNLVRVTMNSDSKDPATGERYSATSDPVEIVNGDFSVQLKHEPSIAGYVAVFQAIIIDANNDVDETNLNYIWETSGDNGKTWTRLAKKYQGVPTLNIQADPTNQNEEAASLVYIRVRVVETTGQNRVRISNAQPLTAQVGTGKLVKKNVLKVKGKTVTVSANKASKVAKNKAFNIKKAKGKVTFKKVSGNKKITIGKKGKVKVKAGLKSGKTYKVRVKVTATGAKGYVSVSKTVTVKVKVQ